MKYVFACLFVCFFRQTPEMVNKIDSIHEDDHPIISVSQSSEIN